MLRMEKIWNSAISVWNTISLKPKRDMKTPPEAGALLNSLITAPQIAEIGLVSSKMASLNILNTSNFQQ